MKLIERTFESLYGQPCWGVQYEPQSNLTMNFGDPSLRVREPFSTKSESDIVRRLAARRLITVRGKWWLWIYRSHWSLSAQTHLIASSSSPLLQRLEAAGTLNGQKLTEATVTPRTGATRFTFDLGGVLDVRPFDPGSDDILWVLYKPRGYSLSVRGNGTFDHQPVSEDDKRPRVLQRSLSVS